MEILFSEYLRKLIILIFYS